VGVQGVRGDRTHDEGQHACAPERRRQLHPTTVRIVPQ
jgi:hypothetical protein